MRFSNVTQIKSKDITGDQLISDADKAMYHAKKLGMNRVVVYNNEMNIKDFKKTLLLVDDENTILRLVNYIAIEMASFVLPTKPLLSHRYATGVSNATTAE